MATKKTTTKKKTTAKAAASSAPKKCADGLLEEVVLNWTDLTGAKTGATAKGSNKYYKAKIFEENGQFKVLFNYGRVGQAGQQQIKWCATLDAARRTMNSKVNAKMAKGYHKVDIRSEDEERKKAGVNKKAPPKKKTSVKRTRHFHDQVEDLLRTMYGATGKAVRKGLSSDAGASEAAPLGNLSDKQLDKGADILTNIEKLLKKKGSSKQKFIDLTNDYLSEIPRTIDHAIRGGRLNIDLIVMNSQDRVDKERQFLTILRDAHLQKDIFAAAAEVEDPMEVWYDGLKCDLDWIDPKSKEYKEDERYFDKGQSPMNSNFYNKLKVKRIWKLERNGKKPDFTKHADEMLSKKNATGMTRGWHGTRTENLMGISRSGLLMPENLPKGVHITGKAFGKGIYHAPCWEDAGENRKGEDGKTYKRYNGALKSMNYTSMRGAYYDNSASGALGYLFLEEIVLGVPEVHLTACWDKARPDKGKDYIYARAFGNPQLSHDEIVTFAEDASRLTHLLEICFKR